MTIAPEPTAVMFDEHSVWVDVDDGRILGVSLAWFPWLLHGSLEARGKARIRPSGFHWDELDKDISIASLLAGRSDMTRSKRVGGWSSCQLIKVRRDLDAYERNS